MIWWSPAARLHSSVWSAMRPILRPGRQSQLNRGAVEMFSGACRPAAGRLVGSIGCQLDEQALLT